MHLRGWAPPSKPERKESSPSDSPSTRRHCDLQAEWVATPKCDYALKGSLVWNFLNTVPELSGKLKAPRMAKDSVSPFTAAEVAAVLVIAGTTPASQPSLSR